jgi:outer membrane protein assembly factor BamB
MRRRRLLGALAGITGLAGCGYRAGGGEFRWSSGASGFGGIDGARFDAGRLLLTTRETRSFDFEAEEWYDGGELTVVDPTRGERVADYGFNAPLLSVAHDGESAYAGLGDGTVQALPTPDPRTRDGTRGWERTVEAAADGVTDLAAAAGHVYVAGEGGVTALDAASGSVAWAFTRSGAEIVRPGGGGTAAYAVSGNELLALDGDGTGRWLRGVSEPPPAVAPEGVYVARESKLRALDHRGRERWSRSVGYPAGPPACSEEGLYHVTNDDVVRAFSPDGRERWRHDLPGSVRTGPAAVDGRVFVLLYGALAGVGPEGVRWRVGLDDPEPFDPEFGPFATGEVVMLAGSEEARGYWQSQLRRGGSV